MENQPLLSGRRQPTASQVDLADALDLFGFRAYHLSVCLVGLLLMALCSSMVTPVPFTIDKIMLEYDIGKSTVSLVQSGLLVGGMIGGVLMGSLGDRFGRKICTIWCVIMAMGIGLLHFLLPEGQMGFVFLVALRICLGVIYIGAMVLSGSLIFEYVPADCRASVNSLTALGWAGSSIVCLLCLDAFEMHWRISIGIFAVVSGLTAIGPVCFVSETPRWLFIKGHHQVGYRVMQKILDSKLLYGQDCGLSKPPQIIVPEDGKELTLLEQLPGLFNKEFRSTTILLCLMWIASSGNQFTILLWLPTIIKDVSGAAGFDYMLFVAAQIASVIASLVSGYIIDLIGRKAAYITAAIAIAVSEGLCVLFAQRHLQMLLVASLCTYNFSFVLNFNALTCITPESFPTVIRGSGSGLCMSVGQFSATIFPIAIGALLDVSILWGVITTVGTIIVGACVAFFVTETTNKRLADEM